MRAIQAACLAIALAPIAQDPAPAADPVVEKAAATITAERFAASVEALVAFGTRHSRSPRNVEAGAWVEARFRAAGIDQVARDPFPIGGVERFNVVADIPGTGPHKDEVVLVGAHYDSRQQDMSDPEAPAPGAVDNATGTAALVELAHALKDVPTDRTIRLVAFSGEEQGLVGSRAYARRLERDGQIEPIVLVVNIDMVGHPIDAGRRTLVIESDQGNRSPANDESSRRWADRLKEHAGRLGKLDTTPGPMYGSDYMPFEALGVPCVGLFDGSDNQPFYHDTTDLPDKVDPAYGASAARSALGLVLEAAGRP